MTYTYKVIPLLNDIPAMEAALNDLGAQGYEVEAVDTLNCYVILVKENA